MTKYYIEFRTWAEGRIETPWPFVWFKEEPRYRRRDNISKSAPEGLLERVFTGLDEGACRRFLEEHVAAVVLGTVIDSDDHHRAIDELSAIFGHVEIIGVTEITESIKDRIDEIMSSAG